MTEITLGNRVHRPKNPLTRKQIKKLIEELLTDVVPELLPEITVHASATSNFLQLSNRIDNAETKNEDASRGLIYSYFDFGEAVFKRYKELKPEYGKGVG